MDLSHVADLAWFRTHHKYNSVCKIMQICIYTSIYAYDMCKYVDIDVYNDLYVSLALNMQHCNIMQHLLGFPSFIVAFESQGSGNWP